MTASVAHHRSNYLTQKHFLWALAIAGAIHLVAGIIAALNSTNQAAQIPVHVMNIKLGTSELMATAPDAINEETRRTMDLSSMPLPSLPASPPPQVTAAPPKTKAKDAIPVQKRPVIKKPQKPEMLAPARDQKTTTSAPTQYVREAAPAKAAPAPKGDPTGSVLGNSDSATAEVMQRYTQQISLWLQRYKVYPDELRARGIHGKAVIRMRIDRAGTIKYFRIEQSTGYPELDNAVVTMVRAANPVPAVPENYPAGNLIEFLIPVNYNLR